VVIATFLFQARNALPCRAKCKLSSNTSNATGHSHLLVLPRFAAQQQYGRSCNGAIRAVEPIGAESE
jgi:hypothetical protein